jgi:hypothetical protein
MGSRQAVGRAYGTTVLVRMSPPEIPIISCGP